MDGKSVSMIHKFNIVTDEIDMLYHQASAKMGFPDSEMRILYMLCDYNAGMSQQDIIDITGMSKQTVNSSVNRMGKAGWITLGERSGHRKEILLTPEGRQVCDAIIRPFMEQEEQIFAGWTREEKQIFLDLNQRYKKALRTMVQAMPRRNQYRSGTDIEVLPEAEVLSETEVLPETVLPENEKCQNGVFR